MISTPFFCIKGELVMKDKMIYIECENEKYPMCFNINVMEEIQEEYGSISNWGEIVENKDGEEPKIKDLKNGLLAMINEGIDIENEKEEIKRNPLTSKQVGRLISKIGLKELTEKIKEITVSSTKTGDENPNV